MQPGSLDKESDTIIISALPLSPVIGNPIKTLHHFRCQRHCTATRTSPLDTRGGGVVNLVILCRSPAAVPVITLACALTRFRIFPVVGYRYRNLGRLPRDVVNKEAHRATCSRYFRYWTLIDSFLLLGKGGSLSPSSSRPFFLFRVVFTLTERSTDKGGRGVTRLQQCWRYLAKK